MAWLYPQAVQRGENCRDEQLLVPREKRSGAERGAHAIRKLKKPSCEAEVLRVYYFIFPVNF